MPKLLIMVLMVDSQQIIAKCCGALHHLYINDIVIHIMINYGTRNVCTLFMTLSNTCVKDTSGDIRTFSDDILARLFFGADL